MNHNKLHCYELLLGIAKTVPALLKSLPKGEGFLADQLKRALISGILNLSEGNSRTSIKERNRFFDISLASIAETSSAIDIMASFGYIKIEESLKLKMKLSTAIKMISRLKC